VVGCVSAGLQDETPAFGEDDEYFGV
jgi:hypothetical protein